MIRAFIVLCQGNIKHFFVFSIYTADDLDSLGFKNNMFLITETYSGVIKEDVGTSINVTQHSATKFLHLEPTT